jgi:hypothetical protein
MSLVVEVVALAVVVPTEIVCSCVFRLAKTQPLYQWDPIAAAVAVVVRSHH